ncbi:uncharacterized protein METZ01_LOCUS482213, partial [marine metagenome]
MKKIILLSILATFCFSQTEEWIYHNSLDGVSRVRPDGSENELVVEDVWMDDMSLDKSKLLFFGNHIITIMDIESMDTQTIGFSEYSGINPHDIRFTYDENVIIFSDSGYDLYKYSFIDSSLILIEAGGEAEGQPGESGGNQIKH